MLFINLRHQCTLLNLYAAILNTVVRLFLVSGSLLATERTGVESCLSSDV
jgi:hypothetical protein